MYPFSKRETYFKDEQLKAFNEFLKVEPTPETDYTNEHEETRHVLYVRYPTGAITKDTYWHANRINYQTEKATVEGNRESIVVYRVGDQKGPMKSCTQSEWIEWLGHTYTTTEAPHTLVNDPYAAGRALIKAKFGVKERQFTEEAVAEKKVADTKPTKPTKKANAK